jgi:hypothetical protein
MENALGVLKAVLTRFTAGSFFEVPQHCIQVEGSGFLAWWELRESFYLPSYRRLH